MGVSVSSAPAANLYGVATGAMYSSSPAQRMGLYEREEGGEAEEEAPVSDATWRELALLPEDAPLSDAVAIMRRDDFAAIMHQAVYAMTHREEYGEENLEEALDIIIQVLRNYAWKAIVEKNKELAGLLVNYDDLYTFGGAEGWIFVGDPSDRRMLDALVAQAPA